MGALISVIVPIYKVEQYIERCIKSILLQTYTNFELLLIDDGSPDASLEICKKYQKQDDRIRIFQKLNGGLSSARNYGLDHCKGDYVTFVDSDDYISADYLNNLLSAAQVGDYDIVQCKYRMVPSDSALVNNNIPFDKHSVCHISKKEALNSRNYKVSSCLCIYKKKIFENNRYTVGIINEDDDIYYRLVYAADRIAILDSILYFYCLSPNSITRSGKDKKLDFIDVYKNRISYFKELKEIEFLDGTYSRFCLVLMLTYANSLECGNNKGDRIEFLKLFREYYPMVVKSPYIGVKYKLMFSCFRIAPHILGKIIGKIRS